mmetsp:Transcript_8779/g.27232  ORF Transcript_8779/g.27232 Transcript_8779/m.27232 type:complete len:325 (+) Transcript_8779:234-1208(+)
MSDSTGFKRSCTNGPTACPAWAGTVGAASCGATPSSAPTATSPIGKGSAAAAVSSVTGWQPLPDACSTGAALRLHTNCLLFDMFTRGNRRRAEAACNVFSSDGTSSARTTAFHGRRLDGSTPESRITSEVMPSTSTVAPFAQPGRTLVPWAESVWPSSESITTRRKLARKGALKCTTSQVTSLPPSGISPDSATSSQQSLPQAPLAEHEPPSPESQPAGAECEPAELANSCNTLSSRHVLNLICCLTCAQAWKMAWLLASGASALTTSDMRQDSMRPKQTATHSTRPSWSAKGKTANGSAGGSCSTYRYSSKASTAAGSPGIFT